MTTGLEELQAFAQWLDQHFARHEQEWARMRAARDARPVPTPEAWWNYHDGSFMAMRAQIAVIRRIKTQVELRLLVLQGEADLTGEEEKAEQERSEDYVRWLRHVAPPQRLDTPDVQEDDNG